MTHSAPRSRPATRSATARIAAWSATTSRPHVQFSSTSAGALKHPRVPRGLSPALGGGVVDRPGGHAQADVGSRHRTHHRWRRLLAAALPCGDPRVGGVGSGGGGGRNQGIGQLGRHSVVGDQQKRLTRRGAQILHDHPAGYLRERRGRESDAVHLCYVITDIWIVNAASSRPRPPARPSAPAPRPRRELPVHRPRGPICGAALRPVRGRDRRRPVLACQAPPDTPAAARPDPLRPLGALAERFPPWFYERRLLRPRRLRGCRCTRCATCRRPGPWGRRHRRHPFAGRGDRGRDGRRGRQDRIPAGSRSTWPTGLWPWRLPRPEARRAAR